MNRIHLRRLGVSAAAVFVTVVSLAAAASASAGTVPADLRVVTDTGKTLADVRQYTDTTQIPTSPQAKCFAGGGGGSGKPVTVAGPTALGLTADASQTQAGLRPLLIDDEYLGSLGSLGVCGFGGVSAKDDFSNFWELRVDHKVVTVGGDQVAVGRGDDVLWSLAPANCDTTPPYACHGLPELSLDAPARATPGKPFAVQVFQYSDKGFTKPAAGAIVTGAAAPSDAAGNALVTLPASGTLQATRAGAIPSRVLPMCVNSKLARCPKKAGRPIFGSALADDITGTAGPDSVKSGDGNDAINVRGGGKDQVQCGGGIDKVKADRSDKVDKVSCERVIRRGGKSHKK
jgi:hypothetical protein